MISWTLDGIRDTMTRRANKEANQQGGFGGTGGTGGIGRIGGTGGTSGGFSGTGEQAAVWVEVEEAWVEVAEVEVEVEWKELVGYLLKYKLYDCSQV